MEVETKTSTVLCLWDVERAANLADSGLGLDGASYGAFVFTLFNVFTAKKPSLFFCPLTLSV